MDRSTFELVNYPFHESQKDPILRTRSVADTYGGYIVPVIAVSQQVLPGDNIANLANEYVQFLRRGLSASDQPDVALPPLTVVFVNEFAARFQSLAQGASYTVRVGMVAAAIAAFLSEAGTLINGDLNLAATKFGPAILAELASYQAWKVSFSALEGVQNQATVALSKLADAGRDTLSEMQEVANTVSGIVRNAQKEQTQISTEMQGAKTHLGETVASFNKQQFDIVTELNLIVDQSARLKNEVSGHQANIDAFKQALREETKIEAAKKLWDDRAWWSGFGFWISAFLLFCSLVVVPIIALKNLDLVIDFLRHVSETTLIGIDPNKAEGPVLIGLAINRIVVITIPLALYFWMVRILVRYNTRSQMLGDDAKQRHTMMNTYFHLIERQGAVKEDRALILNALFRPTPGSNPSDSVDPPNFTELMDKAMGKN